MEHNKDQQPMDFGYNPYLDGNQRKSVSHAITNLSTLISDFKRRMILIPEYQRDHVWDSRRRRIWAHSIRQGTTFATFFCYQIGTQGPLFLADGCQRLFTTLEIISYPQKFGFADADDAETNISLCQVPVIRMSCESHEEGYRHFVMLNSHGTIMTPSELYKGRLVRDDPKSIGSWVYDNLHNWMRERTSIVMKHRRFDKQTPNMRNKEVRGNFALLLQYLSNYRLTRYWNWVSTRVKPGHEPIESLLADELEKMTTDEAKQAVDMFLKFISEQVQLVRYYLDNNPKHGKGTAISHGLLYHILHFSIYARNVKVSHSEEYIQSLIDCSKRGTLKLQIIKNGVLIDEKTSKADALEAVKFVCEYYNIDMDRRNGDRSKKNRNNLLPGLEHSHIAPFSTEGDGQTIPEPAPLNRKRGAKPMTQDEIDMLIDSDPLDDDEDAA